eukprot:2106310-Pleurochrysis_carterae.AAC.1
MTPLLQSLANLRCQHSEHARIAGGSKQGNVWSSGVHAAYPPDFNFLVARVFASLATCNVASETSRTTNRTVTNHVEEFAPTSTNVPSPSPSAEQTNVIDAVGAAPVRDTSATPAQPSSRQTTPFKRTLGEYPLRSRAPAALLATRARADKPVWGR